MHIISGDIRVSILEDKEENYKLLEKWCSKEEIYKHFEQRILNYDEIVNKYFDIVEVYGDFDMTEYNKEKSRRFIVVLKRK